MQQSVKWNDRDLAWPDLTKPIPDLARRFTTAAQSFWKYEWENHGTCSENMYTQTQYFDAAVSLRKPRELLDLLHQARIYEGNKVAVRDVNQTIAMAKNNKVPDLKCSSKPGIDRPVLQEIGICLDRTLNPIDCPIQSRRTNTCIGRIDDQLYFALLITYYAGKII